MQNQPYTPLSETAGKKRKKMKQEYIHPRMLLLPLSIGTPILAQSQSEGYTQQPGVW